MRFLLIDDSEWKGEMAYFEYELNQVVYNAIWPEQEESIQGIELGASNSMPHKEETW